MGKTSGCRHPLLCVVPPYMLESVARNGNDAQRHAALDGLALATTVRAFRAAAPAPTRGASRQLGLAALTVQKHRSIFDAGASESLPGTLRRSEGAPATGDAAVDEAYDGLGHTFDLYLDEYGRNSIDDEGLPLNATVHYGHGLDNAFWDGQRMIFGDGSLFNRFTASLDVIGHELTHGVTQDEAGLVYFLQSGALNESLSDVFGILVKQRARNQAAAASNWLIGEELFTGTRLKGKALRSMAAPGTAYDDPLLGKDPQPGHMRDYVYTMADNGGVHINSGIPNHAFYLVATRLGGYAWEVAGQIWYTALRDPLLRRNSGFRAFARRTVAAANALLGPGSSGSKTVVKAWADVGIKA